jgi:hypothetical protein
MSIITAEEYKSFSDEDKLGILQLMYHDLKGKPNRIEDRELIIQETQKVYSRLKHKGN